MSANKLKRPCGPLGRRVADAIAMLRVDQNLTYEELSRLTKERGRWIPPLGLRRIFIYERRIDLDDLAVLAEVLHTTPENLINAEAADTYREDCLRWLLAETEHQRGNA